MTTRLTTLLLLAAGLTACATSGNNGTLGELEKVQADLDEVALDDSLERAAQSYRRYLEETSESALTPEAMRRLADLQIEQEYGVLGGRSGPLEMAAPDPANVSETVDLKTKSSDSAAAGETELEFEQRATERQQLLSASSVTDSPLDPASGEAIPDGPREAIAMYRRILQTYPNYERNDQVLYQMSRAYDEIGEPDEAMAVMDRLVAEYPHSRYLDEVFFRRGEYYFVRKNYRDAEDAYAAIIRMDDSSSYYELALYKMGWSLYKQQFYEEALQKYLAMLDHRQAIGYDFDHVDEESAEHRVADTFRVVSLSFSNLGGPEVVDEFFAESGQRPYADKIYSNLGEFYFSKLRYDDAASVYRSFIESNSFHKVSPHFSMRVVEIFAEAGFPKLVVESKKEFADRYSLRADYWQHFDIGESQEVVGFLKTNLTDLANHYHALYQEETLVDEQPANFAEAERWYREFLVSFPTDGDSPQINYQLADLLLEDEKFGDAAQEYERTAYGYAEHEQASAAGYAAIFAHRQHLEVVTGASRLEAKEATVSSSLRFADTFPAHEQAATVLGAAADDLYEMDDFPQAIAAAQKLIERYPDSDASLRRGAWAVIAHSSIDLAEYPDAELAYMNVLELTAAEDESRAAVIDGLAAAIYKQGEQANLMQDFAAAADHFLRIRELAPTSDIRSVAEYDAAAALMKLKDWSQAAGVLEQFRADNPQHELHADATKQLAFIYREDGQTERAAAEHERISAEAGDPELSRAALLTAAELYDEVGAVADAIRVYELYVYQYPQPLDIAMESRSRLAELWQSELNYDKYYQQLNEIVTADRDAGENRTDRSRYLAAKAALVLAEQRFQQFADLELRQPFEESLSEKQRRMDVAMSSFESLVDYQVAEVTAAATYYIAEVYFEFSAALLGSERPTGLSESEKVDYELVIEEEAYPFEERAIEMHEENFELLSAGIFNPWVQQSLDRLAVLMPGRYAKNEISDGYVGSIDTYAYRMPIAPEVDAETPDDTDTAAPGDAPSVPEATAQTIGPLD
ncbi:MAG: tetratricopeptide repeat protein [Gammaproteobacteria bacterium]|nr:tetratricopeptide repeat protein [Gammaproteobacteria bacterium]